jgi:hypothetical protein
MRCREKEITDRKEMEAFLRDAPVCRIGLCDGNRPYMVPVSFVYERGAIFIHSAPEGEKIRILKENPRVCVEVDEAGAAIPAAEPCRWSLTYRSVIAEGMAEWVFEKEEKILALSLLMEKYSGRPAREFPLEQLDRVVVIRIPLVNMTGKVSPPREAAGPQQSPVC